MKLFKNIVGIAISISFLASCASMKDVAQAPFDAGLSKSFSGDYELVKTATLASMQNLNINIKETKEIDNGFIIIFTKSISAFSWGEVGRVLVEKSASDDPRVFVHSAKRAEFQVTGTDEQEFADGIFRGIQEILDNG